ncbi:hypothetical protein AMTR_s00006p00234690 [Amborella trichopoda]|uniref:Uncharacterized protein n=1 Tax=Amborella trichopoda TaxID=13333 RepID=W1PDM2_AMBTC|nr:hypothetical protein AMTR_s00006p00234690 [Amborella trichopoda]
MGASRFRPSNSSVVQSSGSHASGGPVASSHIGSRVATRVMMPPDSKVPALDVPPRDVIGFPVAP